MGIKDYFTKKKYLKELNNVATLMECETETITPPDLLSIQSFIYSSHNEELLELRYNNECCIETYILGCFYLANLCVLGIRRKNRKETCAKILFENYVKALSKKFNYKSDVLENTILDRFIIYEEVYSAGLNNLCETFSKILANAKYNKNSFNNTDTQITIDGMESNFNKNIQTLAFLKGLDTACSSLTKDTIDYFNYSLFKNKEGGNCSGK